MKKFITIILLIAFIFALPARAGKIKGVKKEVKKVNYILPNPGILPDHPLYFLKRLRDFFWLALTFNPQKKAELLLLFSDKKIAMSRELANKGKFRLALKTALEAEKEFEKLIRLSLKKQAIKNNPEFTSRIKLSYEKHREVVFDIAAKSQLPEDSEILQSTVKKIQENTKLLKEL